MAGSVVLPLGYFVDPGRTHVPLCPFHALTGLNCPLCGATRATHSLLHGDFGQAWHDNALFLIGLPFLLLAGLQWLGVGRSWPDARNRQVRGLVRPALRVAVLIVVLAFTIVRNLPIGASLSPAT
ncbi:MAG: hypothetical protein JWN95_3875 [Frankiales bacterium]|nr:hypothetical protein [Frankiales bacterium]